MKEAHYPPNDTQSLEQDMCSAGCINARANAGERDAELARRRERVHTTLKEPSSFRAYIYSEV